MLPGFLLIALVLAGLLAVALLLRRLAGQEWLRRTILEGDTPAPARPSTWPCWWGRSP